MLGISSALFRRNVQESSDDGNLFAGIETVCFYLLC